MKFGGTSVEDVIAFAQVAQIVRAQREYPVVVVSAMSGVTDALDREHANCRRGWDLLRRFGLLKSTLNVT